jgi:hypothetical protein
LLQKIKVALERSKDPTKLHLSDIIQKTWNRYFAQQNPAQLIQTNTCVSPSTSCILPGLDDTPYPTFSWEQGQGSFASIEFLALFELTNSFPWE